MSNTTGGQRLLSKNLEQESENWATLPRRDKAPQCLWYPAIKFWHSIWWFTFNLHKVRKDIADNLGDDLMDFWWPTICTTRGRAGSGTFSCWSGTLGLIWDLKWGFKARTWTSTTYTLWGNFKLRTSARGDICSRSRNSKHWLLRQSWL